MLDLLASMAIGFAVFAGTCIAQIMFCRTPSIVIAISLAQAILIEALVRAASYYLGIEAFLLYFFLGLAWLVNILTGVSAIQKTSN